MIGTGKDKYRWAGPFFALGTLVLAIGVLRFAAPLLIPIGIAVLLAFLLTPAVRWLEHHSIPRLIAVGAAVGLVIVAMAGLGWIIGKQTNELLDTFPQYEGNLRRKLASLHSSDGTMFSKLRAIARKVDKEISREPGSSEAAGKDAVKVTVVKPESPLSMDTLPELARSVAPAAGGTVLAFALLGFVLMRREDLRERIFGLVGRGRLPITTRALDEATERIMRTLSTQFAVNSSFGIGYGMGLYVIGIPFAPLWGLLAVALRYVPFVGAVLALSLPFLVSVLTMQGWQGPLLVAGLFVILELVAFGMETWLIGPGIGISPTATLIMLAFWTWLWGPIALLLATPLSACLMVLARFLPHFRFIEIALGDRPVLNPPERLYQRLLSRDVEESTRIVEARVLAEGFVGACDDLMLPALANAAVDAARNRISPEEYDDVLQNARLLVDAGAKLIAATAAQAAASARSAAGCVRVLCVARDDADRIGLLMLEKSIDGHDLALELCSTDLLVSETVDLIGRYRADVIVIGSMPPGGLMFAKLLCRRLRKRFHRAKILVARWGGSGRDVPERATLLSTGATEVYSSIEDLRLALIASGASAQADTRTEGSEFPIGAGTDALSPVAPAIATSRAS